ncbi:hypothetical protein [Candidatus Manganitrophus noduliformans]|uniref:Uncharacterized protein n=1 Tax=Candidatus Manganitrophus noduliformans TaxID=2606439 RepID=A0A7X6DMP3_9BACT|nr:hypothetical protein [Candidatus Manganitrophus noduliformans]NKE69904.1 hypothetical protein [Candidatus Manganitrophus noduliformans]
MRRLKTLTLIGLLLVASTVGAAVFPTPCSATNPTNCSRGTWGQELRDFFDDTFDLLTGKLVTPYTDTVNVEKYASLAAAVTDIGSATKTLLIPSNQACSTAITFPSTLTVEVTGSGKITKSTGCTLTFNAPFEAPLKQVFSGFSAGDVTFGSGRQELVFANWFGASSAETAGNNATYVNTAVSAAGANALVVVPRGVNYTTTDVTATGKILDLHNSPYGFYVIGTQSRYFNIDFKSSGATRPGVLRFENIDAAALDVGSVVTHYASGAQQGYYGFAWQGAATTDARFEMALAGSGDSVEVLRIVPNPLGVGHAFFRLGPDSAPAPGATMHLIANGGDEASGLRIERSSAVSNPARYGWTIDSDGNLELNETAIGLRLEIEKTTGRVKIQNKLHIPVVATGSLPAAGAAEDGSVLIEDAGAGDRNIIFYAGGQRFRIDGGSPF